MKATQSTFLGLEITKTSRGFEVKNSTDLVESLSNLYGLENSKPTANPGGRSTVMELATAILLDGHDYSNFRTAVGQTCNSPSNNYPRKSSTPRQRASAQ